MDLSMDTRHTAAALVHHLADHRSHRTDAVSLSEMSLVVDNDSCVLFSSRRRRAEHAYRPGVVFRVFSGTFPGISQRDGGENPSLLFRNQNPLCAHGHTENKKRLEVRRPRRGHWQRRSPSGSYFPGQPDYRGGELARALAHWPTQNTQIGQLSMDLRKFLANLARRLQRRVCILVAGTNG